MMADSSRRRPIGQLLLLAGLVLASACASTAVVDDETSFPVAVESDGVSIESPTVAPIPDTSTPAVAATPMPDSLDVQVEAPPPTSSSGLGEVRELQLLADRCFVADFEACDSLAVASAAGSLYESYGATCGGRIENSTACPDVFVGSDMQVVTLLAEGVLLRAAPAIDAEPLVAIRGYVGAEVPLLERSSDRAWVRTLVLGTDGWFYAGFAVPAPEGFLVARTADREPAVFLDSDSESLAGSFVLAEASDGDVWTVRTADGRVESVRSADFNVLSTGELR